MYMYMLQIGTRHSQGRPRISVRRPRSGNSMKKGTRHSVLARRARLVRRLRVDGQQLLREPATPARPGAVPVADEPQPLGRLRHGLASAVAVARRIGSVPLAIWEGTNERGQSGYKVRRRGRGGRGRGCTHLRWCASCRRRCGRRRAACGRAPPRMRGPAPRCAQTTAPARRCGRGGCPRSAPALRGRM